MVARETKDFAKFAPVLEEWVALTREACSLIDASRPAYDVRPLQAHTRSLPLQAHTRSLPLQNVCDFSQGHGILKSLAAFFAHQLKPLRKSILLRVFFQVQALAHVALLHDGGDGGI